MAFNRRFDASIGSARARVLADEIGTVSPLTVISRDPDGAVAVLTAASAAIATIVNNPRNSFRYD